MNAISLFIGLIAAVLAFVAFFPLIGWLYWLIIPVAIVGLIFGMLSNRTSGRTLNIIVILIGLVRLMLGGGVI